MSIWDGRFLLLSHRYCTRSSSFSGIKVALKWASVPIAVRVESSSSSSIGNSMQWGEETRCICNLWRGDWERRSRRGLESFQGHSLAVKHPQTEGMHGMSAKYGGHDWDVNISRTVTYTTNGDEGRLCVMLLSVGQRHRQRGRGVVNYGPTEN